MIQAATRNKVTTSKFQKNSENFFNQYTTTFEIQFGLIQNFFQNLTIFQNFKVLEANEDDS